MTLFSSTGTINSNVWTHLAVVIDKDKQLIRFFRDNVLEGAINAEVLNLVNNSNVISIGKNDDGKYFSGILDDVRMYDTAMTTDEISSLYNEKFKKNLILHYDFEQYDHASGKVYDESKYGSHGNLINKEIESEDFTKDIGQYVVSGTAFKAEIDQYIEIPTTSSNIVQGKNLENCTFAAWVKTNNLNSFEPIIHKHGVFSFGLNYGHATLQLGDGTKFHDLPAMTLIEYEYFTLTADGNYRLIKSEPKSLEVGGTIGLTPTYNADKTEMQITGNSSAWYSNTSANILVNTQTVGKIYEFEVEYSSTTGAYMIFGFSSIPNPGTGWNGSGESYSPAMLLNWNHSSKVNRHDSRDTYENGTGWELNGQSTTKGDLFEYWRLTVVEETHSSGVIYNNILYEGFTLSERTPKSRVMYGLASKMNHTWTSASENFFRDNSNFYLRMGSLVAITFKWKNFVEITKVPIVKKEILDMSNKLITDINFNKPIQLSSELPGRSLELTSGYQDGGIAVKINQAQHIEIDGNAFSNNNMNTMTFSAWIKPDDVEGKQTIFSRYGLENNVKLQMNDNELVLSINSHDKPTINNLSGTKQYVSNQNVYMVNVYGRVKDASGGKLYIFSMYNDYSVNYLEDVLVEYAKANVTYVPFQEDNIYYSFEKNITTYAHGVDSLLTSDIQFDSDFFVYFVAIDALHKATVEKLHYSEMTNLTTVDNSFEIKNVNISVIQNVHVNYTITTPSSNPVEVYSVAYMQPTDFPTNYIKIADINAGLINSDRTFSLTKLYNKTNNQTITNIAMVNTIYLYMYAVDVTNGQRVSGNKILIIDELGPYVYMPITLYDQFNNKITISEATMFSSEDVLTVYPPVVFESSVNLSDDNAVLEFYRRYISPLSVHLLSYTIEPLNTFELYDAFIALDGTKEKIVNGNYKIAMLFVMSDGSIKIKPSGGKVGLSIPTVNWANSGFNTNQHGGDMYWAEDWRIHLNTQLSGNGNRFIATKHTNNSSGIAYVYEYNTETQEWGKFDASGVFVKGSYHNLSKSGTWGHYGINSCMSADGNTLIVGSYYDYYRGAAYIWQFDATTYEWGKWNADGSFTAGTPHIVGDNTSSTWREGHPYCQYGEICSLSADGKRALIGGGYNDNQRFRCYIWDYDEYTATWGGFDSYGTYQVNKPYEIYKSGNNWGYGGIRINLSYDGKRLMFCNYINNTSGQAGVMDYDETTYEWGKKIGNGTFTSHKSQGYGNSGYDNDHHRLYTSGVYSHVGMFGQLSGDGKTIALFGYHNSDHGSTIVWQFNEETYQWGKFGANYESFSPGQWFYLQKQSGVGHHGHGGAISADGRTIIVSGYWQNGYNKVFLWEYNPETAEWGKFKADGSFVTPTSTTDHSATHYFNHSSNVTAYSNISGDGSTIMAWQSTQVRLWKGLITQDERSVVVYNGKIEIGKSIKLETILSTTVDSVKFKELGSVLFSVYDVDWSNETTNNDNTSTGDYRLLPGTAVQPRVAFGTNRMVVGKSDNISGGKVRVYDYNEDTDEWGKFDTNKSFTKDAFYNLDLSGKAGYYGNIIGISLDDKIIVSGGWNNSSGYGCLFVWHYNQETAEWGKFNADGSFVTEPHDLSNPSNSWSGNSPYCKKISVSVDGKRFTFAGGHNANNGRIYIMDYDEKKAMWGRKYLDGTFKSYVDNDFSTMTVIETNNPSLAYNTTMSGDGKTIAAGRHTTNTQGYVYVWKYNEETMQWGKWNSDGSFTSITKNSDGKFNGFASNAYYDLERNNTTSYYGTQGGPCFSIDGNTLAVISYYSSSEGASYIWQYNTETHEWGKFNADGSFVKPTSTSDHTGVHRIYKSGLNSNWGYSGDLSGDGKTIIIGGHNSGGTAFIFEYNDVTAKWGRFEANGSFTENEGHRFYSSASNWTIDLSISPDNRFVYIGQNSANVEIFKGVIRSIRTEVEIGRSYGGGFISSPLVFTGSVKADQNNDTTYYLIATLNNTLNHSEVRNMIKTNLYNSAIITDTLSKGSGTEKLSKVTLDYVLDSQNKIVESYKVNQATVYLYATNDNIAHDYMTKMYVQNPFMGSLYSVITSVNYNKFMDIIYINASVMTSNLKITKYYKPVPFTNNVDLTKLKTIKNFIINNSEVVVQQINTNVVYDIPAIEITHAYDNLMDPTQKINIDITKPTDYSFFMVVEDIQGNQELSYTTFYPRISSVSEIGAKIEKVEMSHVFDENGHRGTLLNVYNTDWSNETTNNDNTSTGDYRLFPSLGSTHNILSFGTNRFIVSDATSNQNGNARVYEYNPETDEWGKFTANGSFTKDASHNFDKTGLIGNYGSNCAMSLDDKTIAIGGYYDGNGRGVMHVYKYDEVTAKWGRFNADGSFTPGEFYNLSNTSNNWSGYYVYSRRINLSADGKRLSFGAHGNVNQGRIYVIDYNEETAEWGRKYGDGSFKPYVENDFTTMTVFDGTNFGSNNFGYFSFMSADGKTLSVSRNVSSNQGYCYVWKFNDETMQWGKWNMDGTFIPVPASSDGKLISMTSGAYYDLERNNASTNYGGANRGPSLSIDGNTLAVISYPANGSGRTYIWQYNTETHQWGKYNADGSFSVPTSTSDHSAVHVLYNTGDGHIGHGGDISGDGKTLITSGHNTYGTGFIWEYDDVTAKWGRFEANGTFTENSSHRMYSTASQWGHDSFISPDNRFIFMQYNGQNVEIFKGVSRGIRSEIFYGEVSRAPKLTFKGVLYPSDTNNSVSQYYLMATTNLLTRTEAREMFADASKSYAIIIGNEKGYSLTTRVITTIPNVITKDGTIVPVNAVNNATVYFYSKELRAPIDSGYEDMEIFSINPFNTRPYALVNIVQSSFSGKLQIAGSVFSAYYNIDKVYTVLYSNDIDLSEITDETFKLTAEANATIVPAVTLSTTTPNNVGIFSVVPTKMIDNTGSYVNIENPDDTGSSNTIRYQVRLVAVDTSGQYSVVKPVSEDDGDYEIPTSLTVNINKVEMTETTIDFEATVSLISFKYYDYYAIAITQPDTKNKYEIRDMLFDASRHSAVKLKEKEKDITFKASLTHVIDIANDRTVLASQVNSAQIFVYVKANGTVVGGGYEDIDKYNYFATKVVYSKSIDLIETVMILDIQSYNGTSVINDLSGKNNNATVNNGVLTYGEDVDGFYIEFDGITTFSNKTYITLNHILMRNVSSSSNNTFTFDISFKIDANHTYQDGDTVYFCFHSSSNAARLYCIYQTNINMFIMRFATDSTALVDISIPKDSIQRHTWVYDGSTLNIYVNGVKIASKGLDFYGPAYFYINKRDNSIDDGRLAMKLYGVNIIQKAMTTYELASMWKSDIVPTDLTWTQSTTSSPFIYTAPGGYNIETNGVLSTSMEVYKLFNGLSDYVGGTEMWQNSWATGSPQESVYITLTLPNAIQLGAYSMFNDVRNESSADWAPNTWTLEASNDGINWTLLHTGETKLTKGESKLYYTNNTESSFTIFRWNFQQVMQADDIYNHIGFTELVLHKHGYLGQIVFKEYVPIYVPRASVAEAEYIPFQDMIKVTAASAYSRFNNIVGMYPVIAFAKDVDLDENTDKVYQFIVDNFDEQSVNLPVYAVNDVISSVQYINVAYNNLDNSMDTVSVDEKSQLRVLIRDATAIELQTTEVLDANIPKLKKITNSDPPTDGLVLWINPDKYTSGNIVDTISGNAVSPVYAPQYHSVNGISVKAWNYSTTAPSSAGTTLTSYHSLSTVGGFTFARWMHFEKGYTNWRRIFVDYSSNSSGAWYLTAKTGTHHVAQYFYSVGDIRPTLSSSANDIDYNKWQLVVATGTPTGFTQIYVIDADDALSQTNLPQFVNTNQTQTATNYIHFKHMTENTGSLVNPAGWVGDTYMYNKQLSQTEVFELWKASSIKYKRMLIESTVREFPPINISSTTWTYTQETSSYLSTTTLFTGSYMDGEYKAWTEKGDPNTPPSGAFNKQTGDTLDSKIFVSGDMAQEYSRDWADLYLEMPSRIQVESYTLTPTQYQSGLLNPTSFKLYGSSSAFPSIINVTNMEALSWDLIDEQSNYNKNIIFSHTLSAPTNLYRSFKLRVVREGVIINNNIAVGDFSLNGYREVNLSEVSRAVPVDSSEQGKSSNSLLPQTNYNPYADPYDTVFDYMTTNSSYPANNLSKITLANGDSFYAPPVSSASDLVHQNVGKYMDGGNFPSYNRSNVKGVDVGSASTNNGFVWYYEPAYRCLINKITLVFGAHNNTEWIHQVGGVSKDGVFTMTTNIKINDVEKTLPYSINSSGNNITVTFNPVVAGPNTPLKFVITQNNNNIQLYKMTFEFEEDILRYNELMKPVLVTDGYALGKYISRYDRGVTVYNMDWSKHIGENKMGNWELTVNSAYSNMYFSANGKLLISKQTSTSVGNAKIFEYNEETDEWGKFNLDGSFTKNASHNFDNISGTHFGLCEPPAISADGKTIAIGGYWSTNPHTGQGQVYVWQFNENTRKWGKWNADGSFKAGNTVDCAHDLSNYAANVNAYYAISLKLSYDGKRLFVDQPQWNNNDGRHIIFDYNDDTCQWGRKYADGTFKPYNPNNSIDYSTYYVMDIIYQYSGWYNDMSADGKTLVCGQNNGNVVVWKYNEKTCEWGKWNNDGSFKAVSENSTGRFEGVQIDNVAYYDLYRSGITNYGQDKKLSADGKTLIIGANQSSTAGTIVIWHYNEETHEWGRFKADGSFVAPISTSDTTSANLPHIIYRSDNGSGRRVGITHDGKTVLTLGVNSTLGKGYIYEYNDETATWGKFDASESFTENEPHIVRYGTNGFGNGGAISPCNRFVSVHDDTTKIQVYKGTIRDDSVRNIMSDGVEIVFDSKIRTIINFVEFKKQSVILKGSVVADENYKTMYYILATSIPLTTNDDKRAIINGLGFSNALVIPETQINANSIEKLIDVEITHVVDNSIEGSYSVHRIDALNQPYIYLYATAFESGHEDIDMKQVIDDRVDDLTPYVSVSSSTAKFKPFEGEIILSGLTCYSVHNDIVKVYDPIVVLNSVVKNNFESLKLSSDLFSAITFNSTDDSNAKLLNNSTLEIRTFGESESTFVWSTKSTKYSGTTPTYLKDKQQILMGENMTYTGGLNINIGELVNATVYILLEYNGSSYLYANGLNTLLVTDGWTHLSDDNNKLFISSNNVHIFSKSFTETNNITIPANDGSASQFQYQMVINIERIKFDLEYIKKYITTNNIPYIDINVPQNSIGVLPDIRSKHSIVNISGETQLIDEIESCEIYIVCEDADGVIGMTPYGINNDFSIIVNRTDWSQEPDNTPDYLVPMTHTEGYTSMSSGEISRILQTRHNNTTSGYARVYDYNPDTNKWGKYNTKGSFTENAYHNLDKSSTYGHYGLTSGISMDGNSVLVGGYYDANNGCMFVWQWNTDTYKWGKYNANGSFTNDEPHDLSMKNNSAGCYYGHGQKSYISHNGKRVATGGHAGSYNRVYIWDYDEDTAKWGKIEYKTGNFIPRDGDSFVPNYITTPSTESQERCMSADGNTILVCRHTAQTSGVAYVWKYNKDTYEWGKFYPNGRFVKDEYYDLSRSGVYGYYGHGSGSMSLSADGNTAVVGGYYTSNHGSMVVWQYNEETHEWGKWLENGTFMAGGTTSGMTYPDSAGYYIEKNSQAGHFAIENITLSANGRHIATGGYGQNTMWVYDFNPETNHWGRYDYSGKFHKWNQDSTYSGGGNRIYNTVSNFGQYPGMSPDNKFVFSSQNNTNLYVFKGIPTNINHEFVFAEGDGTSQNILYDSTIRTKVKDASLSNKLTFNVDIIADKIYNTTYYIIATIVPLSTNEEKRLIPTTFATNMISNSINAGKKITLNVQLNQIIDNSVSNESYKMLDVTFINYVNIYAYAIAINTYTNEKYEDIHRFEIRGDEILLLINETDNNFEISGSVFSYDEDIVMVKYAVFTDDLDLSNIEEVKQFVFDNGTTISGFNYPERYVVKTFSTNVSTAFDSYLSSTTVPIVEGEQYQIRLVALNENNYSTMLSNNMRFEMLEDILFQYKYIDNQTDSMMFNKTINEKWCAIDANKFIAYTWSAYKDTNTKYGIYLMIVNSNSGSKSDIYEVKYDGSNDYVLPCVCFVNNNIVIAYQLRNGTSNYGSTVYYNVINYDGTNIINNTAYTHGTETRDRNSMTDIVALNDTQFIIVWNDYSQQPYYNQHCNRDGCTNHHTGWYYYYDIQYIVKDTTGTTIKDTVVFENNDTNSHYHKVCLPSINTTTTYYGIVNQYYGEIYLEVYKKSDNSIVLDNKDINTTGLASWNVNDANPICIESLTPDNFVVVWFDNYFNANHSNKIYIREVTYNGTFVTNEILLDTTINYYNYGRPKIFTNNNEYDLFVVRAELINAPNYPVYRYHYKLDTSFNIISKEIKSYVTDLEFNILPHIGNPMNIIKLNEDRYQETIVHTTTETTTLYDTYNVHISTGKLL